MKDLEAQKKKREEFLRAKELRRKKNAEKLVESQATTEIPTSSTSKVPPKRGKIVCLRILYIFCL